LEPGVIRSIRIGFISILFWETTSSDPILGVKPMAGINSTPPLEPKRSGFLSVEVIMDLESKRTSKVLRTFSDD
jgi:hypothetical protein